MSYKGLPEQLVASINPRDARDYAIATGWNRLAGVNGKIAVYTNSASDLDQLVIPIEWSVPDYGRRMAEVVSNLAQKENRPASEILNDLLMPASDVLRFRLEDSDTATGLLPLNRGIDLLTGARRALLSAACSVDQPQRTFHPRLSCAQAEQLLEATQLAQTERGSFTAVVSCPLDAAGKPAGVPNLPLFEAVLEANDTTAAASGDRAGAGLNTPFTRQVTSLLMASIDRIAKAIDADDIHIVMKPGTGDPPISGNLCEALRMMQPAGDHSRLTIGATWSRALPRPAEARIPSVVHLRRELFPTIESIALALRPNPEPKKSRFVGLVDLLNGDPEGPGRVSGEVRLLILNQEETVRARVFLNADQYNVAWQAHGVGGYVSLRGVLTRGDRLHRITDVSDFTLLKE